MVEEVTDGAASSVCPGEARTASGKEVPSPEPQNVKGGTPEDLKKSGVSNPDANSEKTTHQSSFRVAGIKDLILDCAHAKFG